MEANQDLKEALKARGYWGDSETVEADDPAAKSAE
jgi:hypothetical protein